MQRIITHTEILRLSSPELHALIQKLENELSHEGLGHNDRHRIQFALRAARVELAQRQARLAPKPPGFF